MEEVHHELPQTKNNKEIRFQRLDVGLYKRAIIRLYPKIRVSSSCTISMEEDSQERQVIPEILHSLYEERPFVSCTRCGESLVDFPDGYRISKEFRRGDVILEYALCMPCLQRMFEESSEESKQNLARFHEEHFTGLLGMGRCAFCTKSQAEVTDGEFSIAGICEGSDLLDSAMVCNECTEAMHAVLSEQTTRTWRRFREENFPGVPGDFEPFPGESLTREHV